MLILKSYCLYQKGTAGAVPFNILFRKIRSIMQAQKNGRPYNTEQPPFCL